MAGLLLATLIPPAAGGARALAAPLPAAPGPAPAGPGTVVQRNGTVLVPAGEEGPATTYLHATLPGGAAGPVTARLWWSNLDWWGAERPGWLGHLTWSCAVNGGPFTPCPLVGPRDGKGPSLPLPTAEAAPTLTYAVRVDAATYGSVGVPAWGSVSLTGATGAELAQGNVEFDFVPGTPEADLRTVLHARDRGGVLWRYEGTGKAAKPFKARTRVGGGWGVYTALTKLGPSTANGEGDLVARDGDGALWYYSGSGDPAAPFWPRVRVGGGWNAYTSLTGTPTGLLARDRSGTLWHHRRAHGAPPHAPFEAPVRVGGGWNAYTAMTAVGPGLVARDASGVLWFHRKGDRNDPAAPFAPRERVGGGWNVHTGLVGTGDLGRLTPPDLVARDRDGLLWAYEGGSVTPPGRTRTQVGRGWNIYDTLL
ncbi:tachylectin-related carbohydrate-binding protein [Streptomyces sp. NPDC002057]|uniref:tachylectin-related carbohydrate-binding protein n=1 Tax=Streptomyces sp. NPDC002057 TaxID=3154664 RepID=UPI003333A55C